MSNWKQIISSVAPALGTALGGPLAGIATKYIADKLLGNEQATEQEIAEAILGATPEQLAKLKQLDNQFQLEMKQLEIDIYALSVQDRDSARKMFEVNIWPQVILSALFVLGYFIVLGLLLFNQQLLPASNSAFLGVITTVLGVLTAAVPQILNFWFGSSLGSKEKTRELGLAAIGNVARIPEKSR